MGGHGLSAGGRGRRADARPGPPLLPRPRTFEAPPDGRRRRDGEPEEALDPDLPAQGYRLDIGDDAVRLVGADEDGLRHGRATLAQLRRVEAAADRAAGAAPIPGDPGSTVGATLPVCRIEDWPDFAVRGVMLDVSRDRVPSLETLYTLVDRLAGWKLNHLQLYMEHTFAYVGHEEVWRRADPYTPADLHALDRHCRSRGVELVANQNTLGHFERWLRHERYRPLAISPDGFRWAMGIRRPPLTLDPAKPEAFALVSDLLTQLVPHVASRRVHVGMDEPWELSADRSGEWGTWLERLRGLPALRGRDLLVWGDVLAAHPELLPRLPEGVTVCEWGYEENHPFEDRLGALAGAGVPFWVSPGTSSWLSVSGRVDNMLGNIAGAARAGVAAGAEGLLVTDWGDMGHLQQPPVSDPGLATAAALGWCAASAAELTADHLAALLDLHCYHDPTAETGRAVLALGRTNAMVAPRPPNMSALALHLLLPQWKVGAAMTEGLRREDLDHVEEVLDDSEAGLDRAGPRRPDGPLVLDELRATAALLRLSCHDARLRLAGDGSLASVRRADRDLLATESDRYIAEHRRLWAERFRPGGLDDSTAWLEHLRHCYRSGGADRSWFGPFG